jgi:hypothetical protein
MLDRCYSAAAALCLAVLVWLYARNRDQDKLDNVPIPVQLTLPDRERDWYDIEVNGPSQILASFSGPPSRMRELREQLQRGEMGASVQLTVPAERANDSRHLVTARVSAEDLTAPPGVRVAVMEGHNRIPVTLRRLIERPLPVRLDHALEGQVSECKIEPPTVVVRGPQETLERLTHIATKPYTPTAGTPADPRQEVTTRGTIGLIDELDGRGLRCEPARVNVRLTLRPQRQSFEVQVPVHFLCPVGCAWRPEWAQAGTKAGYVRLRLLGPAGDEPPNVHAFVDLTRREFQWARPLVQQVYADEAVQLQLPKDFQLAQPAPRAEPFRLMPVGPPGSLAPLPDDPKGD